MDDNLQAELERLRAENARLKRDRGRTVSLKVSEKGGVSVYGLGRACWRTAVALYGRCGRRARACYPGCLSRIRTPSAVYDRIAVEVSR